jgi:hypothetical protein
LLEVIHMDNVLKCNCNYLSPSFIFKKVFFRKTFNPKSEKKESLIALYFDTIIITMLVSVHNDESHESYF